MTFDIILGSIATLASVLVWLYLWLANALIRADSGVNDVIPYGFWFWAPVTVAVLSWANLAIGLIRF